MTKWHIIPHSFSSHQKLMHVVILRTLQKHLHMWLIHIHDHQDSGGSYILMTIRTVAHCGITYHMARQRISNLEKNKNTEFN